MFSHNPVRLIGALVALGAFPIAPARADVVRIPAQADVTIYEDDQDFANALGSRIFAGNNNNGDARRALVLFDVSGSVPVGSEILGVRLEMYVERTVADLVPIALHRVTASWVEGPASARGEGGGQGVLAETGDVTWLHRRFVTQLWQTPGGDFVAAPTASQMVGEAEQMFAWTSPEMIDDVASWLETPDANYGWILIGNESRNSTTKAFSSAQAVDDLLRPTLIVDFVPPPGSGACCAASGRCTVGTPETCGASFVAEGAACGPNPCPQPQGACCLPVPDATCQAGTRDECAALSESISAPKRPALRTRAGPSSSPTPTR
ncbi:MAG: DNRLRE domain-containing protein [Myxococcales bacterium]|nr:DNRLRE domain-containing protein [Myxococcales bacterium]